MTSPKLKIEHWAIERVLPYAKNARLHSDAQVAAVSKSIAEFGFVNPCLVDANDVLIAGHCRILSAKQLGMETVPVIRLGHLTEDQARALRLADNQLPQLASWSAELIVSELQHLKLAGYDIPMLGFPESQLRGWGVSLGTDSEQDPEATPEPPKKPIVRKGDLWILGDHRLLCGDATSKSDVETCFGNALPNILVSDPPYGVDYDPNWRNVEAAKGNLAYAASRVGVVHNDGRNDWREAWALFPGDVAYCWHAGRHASAVQASLESVGLLVRSQIIWAKSNYPISRGHYHWRHEPCWYTVRDGKTGNWQGARDQTTLWQINLDKNVEGGHSTQKPIECMKRPIENNSRKGDAVYDPFVGSGTTLIAAEMTGRKALAIEIDPAYCEVVIRRWETFVGNRKATLDGKTLEQVAAARRKGKGNAPRDSRKSVPRKHAGGNGSKRRVRTHGDDGFAAPGGKPAGEPSAVAGDS